MKEKELLHQVQDWSTFTHFGDLNRYKRLSYLTNEQLWRLQRDITKEYYSSIRYILSQVLQIRSYGEIKYFFSLGVEFIREFILRN